MNRYAGARLVAAMAMASGIVVAGGAAAQADPPPGWQPGASGVEYELADTVWSHQGRYPDRLGNWHTGWLNIEENDDVLTGELVDWWCPAGVQPPTAYSPDPDTTCKRKGARWLSYIDYFNVAEFDQQRNRLEVHMDVPAFVGDEEAGTVRVDVVMRGIGAPEVESDDSNGYLTYSEYWSNVQTWGRVDGRRVSGANTTTTTSIMGFTLDSWEPIP